MNAKFKIEEICKGNLVEFEAYNRVDDFIVFKGTVLTEPTNGLVLVAVHDYFAIGMNDRNFLPVMAIRFGDIVGVYAKNEYQGDKR